MSRARGTNGNLSPHEELNHSNTEPHSVYGEQGPIRSSYDTRPAYCWKFLTGVGLRLRISVLWYVTQHRRRRSELALSLIRKPKELQLRTYSAFSAFFQVYGGRRYKEIATTPPQACPFTIERLQCV